MLAALADLESITGHHRYTHFVWASSRVALTSPAPESSLRLVGRAPLDLELSAGCPDHPPTTASVQADAIFDLNLQLPAGCAGQAVSLTTSRALIPAERQGSGDTRELAFQVFEVWAGPRQLTLEELLARGRGLYVIEPIDMDTSPVGVLTNRWDADWYYKIVRDGYRYDGDPSHQQHTAWPFLYPALSALTARVFGLDAKTAMIRLNAGLFLAGLLAVYGLGRAVGLAPVHALLPALWLCFNPFAYYLVAGVSEPLFLLLEAVCLILFVRGRFLLAAAAAGLLVATRFAGVIAAAWIAMALVMLPPRGTDPRVPWTSAVFAYVLLAGGLAADILVKYHMTGHPLSAFTVRAAWQPSTLAEILQTIELGRGLPLGVLAVSLAAMLFMAARGASAWRTLEADSRFLWLCGASLAGFTLLANPEINSAGRYLLGAFPLVIVYLRNERAAERHVLLALLIGLGGSAALFHTMRIWQRLPPF